MPHPTSSRGWRFDALGTVSRVLLSPPRPRSGAARGSRDHGRRGQGQGSRHSVRAVQAIRRGREEHDAADRCKHASDGNDHRVGHHRCRARRRRASQQEVAAQQARHIQIGDDDFDSFNEALHTAPWVVGLAFLVAGSILLTPVFLLVGIIWYKLRKTRLQNEALLKLAEKGVMPPAQAVDSMMSGATPEQMAAAASTVASSTASAGAPVYQQAVIARRRAVWSDLRRGVILNAVGLSFVFYSMIESARRIGSGWYWCSWVSATSCCGGSRTGICKAARAALTLARARRRAGTTADAVHVATAGQRCPADRPRRRQRRPPCVQRAGAPSPVPGARDAAQARRGQRGACGRFGTGAFLLAYRNLKSFRQDAKFSTWLYRIAYNVFLADARKIKELPMPEDMDVDALSPAGEAEIDQPARQAALASTSRGRWRSCRMRKGRRSCSAIITICRMRKPPRCWDAPSARSRHTYCEPSRN